MSTVTEYYTYLHTIPERGFDEEKTAAFVEKELRSFGYDVTPNLNGKTGIMAVYDSGMPGPVVALRADMDALGHIIDGKPCAIHSCGHDAHMSMLLAAAKIIKADGLVNKGKLKLLFQPAEELGTGAKSLLEAGVIDDVEYIFGAHVRPLEEAHYGQASPAIHYASSSKMIVTFHGKPAHGARPHLGVNAIDAAVAAVNAVNAIHLNPTANYSAKATRFICDAGVTNSIPSTAVVTWDLRAQYNDIMTELRAAFKPAVEAAAATVGATVTIDDSEKIPAAELHEEATALLRESITDVVGEDNVLAPICTPGGEDFFFYTAAKPELKAGFFGLGCDLTPGLHHPLMKFNVDALDTGVSIWVSLTQKLLA